MKLSCDALSFPDDKEENVLWLLLNGERREIADGVSLAELIEKLELAPERIAIELNQAVVRRSEWAATGLREGDRLEIVHFVGGGGEDHCFHFCLRRIKV
jgi:thiamine biosynthesis protein ThiS